jgi:hypothetical protein
MANEEDQIFLDVAAIMQNQVETIRDEKDITKC